MASKQEFEAFFREADTDEDGRLTMDELSTIFKKKGYKFSESEIKDTFQVMDTDGDGLISFDEYMEAMGQQPPKVHGLAAMRRVFVSFDKDGNGRIDRNELKSTFKEMGKYLTEEEVNVMMKVADRDKTGDIDYREFLKAAFNVDL